MFFSPEERVKNVLQVRKICVHGILLS